MPLRAFLLVALGSFVVMEPVTYLVHRFVMHGPGMVWHRSHHHPRHATFERNDLFPVVFASITIAVMAVGATVDGLAVLLAIGAGVTAYGLTYLFVHDLAIHQRIPVLARHGVRARRLAEAHVMHHRYGGEPYGMLVPIPPRPARARPPRPRTEVPGPV